MVDAVSGFHDVNNCNSCHNESKTESAVFWCVDCRKALCEACERKHSYFIEGHKVIHLKQMTEIEPKSFSISIKCTKHKEKALEAYCFDHRVPCCSSCVMITHRKCNRVEEAKTAAEELRNSKLILGLQEDFENHKKRMEEMSNKTSENVKSFRDKVTDIQNEISTIRSDINRHLDDIELKANKELAALEKEHLPKMEAVVDMLSGETKRAENDLMILKSCVQYASDEQFLCDIEKLTQEKNKMNEIWEENRTNIKHKQPIVELNDELQKIKNVNSIMNVSLKEEKMVLELDPYDFLHAEPEKVTTFNIDNKCTNITGCVMVDEKRILLANRTLKRVDMHGIDGAHLASLNLENEVWGVDMIDKNKGATTLWNAKKVVLFSIEDKKLALVNSLDCSYGSNIFGVQSYKDRLYIGSKDKIIVLGKNGLLIKEISQPSGGSIRHLNVSDENIFYTNYPGMLVICSTLHGDVSFKFSSPELLDPEGISTDSDNNIYVIGQKSRNVFQLTPNGKFHRILLQHLSLGVINSLFFCKHSNKLIFNTGKTVHVYEVGKRPSQAL